MLVLGAGTYSCRLVGLLLRGRWEVPPRVRRLLDLAATALLVAVLAVATLTDGAALAGFARPAGVAVGAVAAWRRVPLVGVVLLAAGTAAGLRLLGVQ